MRRHLTLLVVLALLFRSLIPAGFMPALAESAHAKSITMVICSGHMAPAQSAQRAGTKPVKSGSGTSLCPYAALAATAEKAGPSVPPSVPVRYQLVGYQEPAHFLIAQQDPGAISARGPPAV